METEPPMSEYEGALYESVRVLGEVIELGGNRNASTKWVESKRARIETGAAAAPPGRDI